jgi:uncharacterized surface protein with fasciclin (FAS1) repeats
MSNITQVVNTDKNMKTLKRGVHASDLDQLLSSTGPFTMFAPSDLAFDKLEQGTMENLLEPENKTTLTAFINSHVVAGKIKYDELKDGEKLKNLQGKELSVKITSGKVYIDGALIQNPDMKSTNGVVHMVDTVLKN